MKFKPLNLQIIILAFEIMNFNIQTVRLQI